MSPVLVHRSDLMHFRVCQFKVENLKVLLDMGFVAGTGNGDIARLEMPAQEDLRGGLAMGRRNRRNCGVIEQFLRMAPPAEGEPGFQNGSILFQMLLHGGTLVMGVRLVLDDFEEAFSRLLAGEYEIENRMMLCGCSYAPGQKREKDNTRALNDIVITRKGSLQIITFAISVNGQFLHRYSADGIIVATPTGSTGYNLSAGGPVVDPKARLMVVSPICPHSMQYRSIVLSPEDEISILIETGHDGAVQEVEAIFDGSHRVTLYTGDRIVIRKSDKTTGIVKLNKVSFFEMLNRKMCD